MHISQTTHSCPEMEAANRGEGEKRPSNPGELPLERLNPQMQSVLAELPIGQVSRPMVSREGIDLLMVCSKSEKNFSNRSPSEIADQLMNERVEQAARQLDSDLHRRAMIDLRVKLKGA
jgi:peptidyl-prolyl cis-trans isomerase SurA